MLYALCTEALCSMHWSIPDLSLKNNKIIFNNHELRYRLTAWQKRKKSAMCLLIVTFQSLLLPYALLLCTPALRHQHRWPHTHTHTRTHVRKAEPSFLQMLTHRVLSFLKNDPNTSPCSEMLKQLSVITKRIKQVNENNSRSLRAKIFPWSFYHFLAYKICSVNMCVVYNSTIWMQRSCNHIWPDWSNRHYVLVKKTFTSDAVIKNTNCNVGTIWVSQGVDHPQLNIWQLYITFFDWPLLIYTWMYV